MWYSEFVRILFSLLQLSQWSGKSGNPLDIGFGASAGVRGREKAAIN